ncbi:hypothetical protein QE374_002965 [Microbacterium sp. SORGH_AS428]|uniref:hypothetical protein n=1 Tax=Microbacterium sp. SORGH_AS_0428 TaxID=3041788 RepID=UPI00285DD31C|nr:hypothetical protein [Microbacterium sp. SORGH_AS_0428]MDR6201056.1 hypothetical protein [Microbacterium sp. SORGH_AS_0428]
MNTAYEDPTKTDMRVAAEIAIDQAGFTLVPEPVRVAVPAGLKMVGSILGDLQSLDANGRRTFYYLRSTPDLAIPKWIANLARASHAIAAGDLYIVVTEASGTFIDSCRDAGAGVLRLTEDGVFEVVLDYRATAPRSMEEAREARVTALRRNMERRVELRRVDLDARYSQAATIIAGMDEGAGDRYVSQFDAWYRANDDWGAEMSRRIDALGPRSSAADIADVEALVEAGPESTETS